MSSTVQGKSSPDYFDAWLKDLGEKVGATVEAEDDVCVVEVDGKVITFRHLPETEELLTVAEIGAAQPDAVEKMALMMMAGNNLFVATGGATLARNVGNETFQLVRRDPIDVLPFERWWTSFMEFVDVLERWRKFVAEYRPDAEKTLPDAPAFGSTDFFRV